jgi:hypothetical protein
MTEEHDSFEETGFWWTQENPDEHMSGILSYNRQEGGLLKLLLAKTPTSIFPDARSYSAIFGKSAKGAPISLFDCQDVKGSASRAGYETREIRVGVIIKGFYLPSLSQKDISDVYVDFQYLSLWLANSGITVKRQPSSRNFIVRYKEPMNKEIKISRDLSIVFLHWSNDPMVTPYDYEVTIKHEIYVWIKPRNKQCYYFFREVIRTLQDFLTIACSDLSYPLTINAITSSDKKPTANGRIRSPQAEVYHSLGSWERLYGEVHPSDMLFTFADIEDRIDVILKHWFDKADLLKPVRDLYVSAVYSPKFILEPKFLTLTQAIESYHRRFRDSTYMTQNELDTDILPVLEAAIPAGINNDFRQSIKNKMKYLHEYSLSKRLNLLIKDNAKILDLYMQDPTSLVEPIIAYRNYFTHYDPKSHKAFKVNYGDVLYLCYFLKFLIELCFLREMGFNSDDIINQLKNNYRYRNIFRKRVLETQ